jgi:hypothetical protein
MTDQSIVSYNSVINPQYQVFVVFADSDQYTEMKEVLTSMNNSIGALWIGTKNIFIDGERVIEEGLDKDHLIAIEAHEIAHSMLGHKAGVDINSEKEADLLAIALLETFGYRRSAQFIKDRIKELYGIDYTSFETEWNESNEEDLSL